MPKMATTSTKRLTSHMSIGITYMLYASLMSYNSLTGRRPALSQFLSESRLLSVVSCDHVKTTLQTEQNETCVFICAIKDI